MTLDELKKAFEKGLSTVAFLGNSANYGVGPDLFLDRYHYVVVDRSPLVDALRSLGRSVYCLEEALGKNAVFRNTSHLIEDGSVRSFLKNNRVTHLALFKNSSKVEAAAKLNGWSVMASSASLSQGLENKLKLDGLAREARVDVCRSLTFDGSDGRSAEKAVSEIGVPCVIQAARGFAGSKTFLVEGMTDVREVALQAGSKALKVSEYVAGAPFTVNACVTSRGTVVGRPVYQITGLDACTANPMGSCGNDFAFGSPSDFSHINDFVRRISAVLSERGYRGIFGVDFVVTEDRLVLIEINPRITASLPLHTDIQVSREEIPLIALHFAEFLGIDLAFEPGELTRSLQEPADAASVVIYNTAGKPASVAGSMKAGVYSMIDGVPSFKRSGVSLSDCLSPEEFFLSPADGDKTINPGIELARLYFKKSVLKDAGSFMDDVSEIIESVKRRLSLTIA